MTETRVRFVCWHFLNFVMAAQAAIHDRVQDIRRRKQLRAKRKLRVAGDGRLRGQDESWEFGARETFAAGTNTPRRPRERGFTLIEVLVALAVTALGLVAAGRAFRVVASSAGRGIEVINRLDGDTRGIAMLRRDLVRIERFVKSERGRAQFDFEAGRQRLTFPIVEPGFPTEPGTYLIDYSVRKYSGGSQLIRSREPYERERTTRSSRSGDGAVVVIEGAYDFAFAYEERAAGKSRWVETWTDKTRLPALIRFTASGPAPLPPVVLRLRIDAELGCADRGAGACTPRTAGALTDPKTPPPTPTAPPALTPQFGPQSGPQPGQGPALTPFPGQP